MSDGTNDYVYGPSGEPVEQIVLSSSTPTFMTYTAANSSWLLTNAGDETAFYGYDAFGTLSFGTPGSPFGYAGQYADASSGLDNMRARWFEPQTGAFATRDPAFAQTDQAYAYAGDDPVNESDPSGLASASTAIDGGVEIAFCTITALTKDPADATPLERAACITGLAELGLSASTANAIAKGIDWAGTGLADLSCLADEAAFVTTATCIWGIVHTVRDLLGFLPQGGPSSGWIEHNPGYKGPDFASSIDALSWMQANMSSLLPITHGKSPSATRLTSETLGGCIGFLRVAGIDILPVLGDPSGSGNTESLAARSFLAYDEAAGRQAIVMNLPDQSGRTLKSDTQLADFFLSETGATIIEN